MSLRTLAFLLASALGCGCSEKMFETPVTREAAIVAYLPLEELYPDEPLRALAKAAAAGDVRSIDALVERGVDVNAEGTSGATVLFWAMRSGNPTGFRRLLALGADPNVVFVDGGSVLHWAAQLDNESYLRSALEAGGNPNLVGGPGQQTPIFKTIGSAGASDASMLELLLAYGADPNAVGSRGNTPAMIAAGVGRFDLVYTLLENGADFSIKNLKGRSLIDRVSAKQDSFAPGSRQAASFALVRNWLCERGQVFQ